MVDFFKLKLLLSYNSGKTEHATLAGKLFHIGVSYVFLAEAWKSTLLFFFSPSVGHTTASWLERWGKKYQLYM